MRAIAQFSTDGSTVRLPPVLFQPMAAEDVSTAVAEAALAEPVNGTVEIAGPDTFTLDESVRKVLEYDNDARKVIADPAAPYSGVKVSEKTLVPGAGKGSHRKFTHANYKGAVTLSGQDGDDAKKYQEKQVQRAIQEVER